MKQKASGGLRRLAEDTWETRKRPAKYYGTVINAHSFRRSAAFISYRGLNTVRIIGHSFEFATDEMGTTLQILYDGSQVSQLQQRQL